jgi:hypothetical protein
MTNTIDKLSFVKGSPRCFWHVVPTGDHEQDEILGERMALEYLAYEHADADGPGLLSHIVSDMPRSLTPIEIAFLAIIAYSARVGRH